MAGLLQLVFLIIIIPFVFTISFVTMLWGVFQYLLPGSHDEAVKEKGKALIMYGIIVFAITMLASKAIEFLISKIS